MKIVEIIQDLLLSVVIAILVPITIYWGVSCIAENPRYDDFVIIKDDHELSDQEQTALQEQTKQFEHARKTFNNAMFLGYIITGFLSLVIGIFVRIHSLALGLIGASILNIMMAIFFNPNQTALLNFAIFLFMLLSAILLLIWRKARHD